jgi:hypothetical protein
MSSVSADSDSPRQSSLLYALTIFLSAFLLFQVQPLISKYILPWFGGSPAVWTTCLLFFQTVLFAGYAYAHWSEHYLPSRWQTRIHLALIVIAFATLPIDPSDTWKPTDSAAPTARILLLLGACVGLPYFVLSTTGPLVQAWFSRAFPDRSPYRLYALSNLGSLLALGSYPFIVEPRWDVATQAWWWSIGFVVFGLLCAYAAIRSRKLRDVPVAIDKRTEAIETPPSRIQLVLWLALPAFASMTLLASTNHVCQDVAPVPFLWVVPLGLYLISFILTFDNERWYWRLPFGLVALGAIYAAVGIDHLKEWSALQWFNNQWDWLLGRPAKSWSPGHEYWRELLAHFTALFAVCVVCHGELVRLRPTSRHLTLFYLMISAGGALGGLFVSLIAPQLFKTYFEWKIAMVGGFLLAAVTTFNLVQGKRSALEERLHARSRLGVAEVPRENFHSNGKWYHRIVQFLSQSWIGQVVFLLGLVVASFVLYDMGRILKLFPDAQSAALVERRNFFGAVRVTEVDADNPPIHRHELLNGRILHGSQFRDPERRHWATTYYSEESGVGRTLGYYRRYDNMRVGAVGLGVGTLATYALPGHTFRFYEINPIVPELADTYFTYLAAARKQRATIEIVLGDARLSLERELLNKEPQRFDLLVLDAFSGDAIPNHLLTKEAFDIYLPHLSQGGAIAVHTSNQYLDLTVVVYGLAKHFGLQTVEIDSSEDDTHAVSAAEWMILSRNTELMKYLRESLPEDEDKKPPANPILWTDRDHNIFDILD